MKIKLITVATALLLTLCTLASCGGNGGNGSASTTPDASKPEKETVLRVGTLKGPTGMGMAKVVNDQKLSSSNPKYTFEFFGAPEDITAKLISGNLDVAAVPVNLAAVINKKTNGAYVIAAINTLGVLHIVENGNSVNSIADLEGKTLHATGQASTPEYMLDYILEKNGLTGKVNIEWHTEHSELATLVAAGQVDLAMLPEPHVTSALVKNASLRAAIDLTLEWDEVSDGDAVQGCLIVSRKAIESNKAKVDAFLDDYKASVDYVNTSIVDASAIIAELGIVGAAKIAEKAIPRCNIVFIEGDAMISSLKAFYTVLFNANPSSIGGTMPNDSLYYKR